MKTWVSQKRIAKKNKKIVELDVTMNLKAWYYWSEMKKPTCVFLLGRIFK